MEEKILKNIESFTKFFKTYDVKNENIFRKYTHSIRVMKLSNEIAKGLNLNEEQIYVANIIGLLHDLSRFEQYTKYQTFHDQRSFDHGKRSVELLEENISDYDIPKKYLDIIKKAIYYHNKYGIEEELSEQEKLYCNIIRDADKIDIIYECLDIFFENKLEEMKKSEITQEIYDDFFKEQLISTNNREIDMADKFLLTTAFIYDINYDISYKILSDNKYFEKILEKYKFESEHTNKQFEEVMNHAIKYVNSKIK